MFPLTSVLLPGAPLGLHIFESRYKVMIGEVLSADCEMGVVLIERGAEVGGSDVRSKVGTMARIVSARRLEGGRWQLLAAGHRRIRVKRWLPDDPYPRAAVEDWPDAADPEPGVASHPDQVRTAQLLRELPGLVTTARGLAARLMGHPESEILTEPAMLGDDPSMVSYRAAAMAPLGPLDRYEVLSAPSATQRLAVTHRLIGESVQLLAARAEPGSL